MTEADLQTKFNKYLLNRWVGLPSAFELKITKEKRIPFSAIKEHQIKRLKQVREGNFPYKIPDVGYDQKPFDCFILNGKTQDVGAYVCIMFYTRGENKVYLIDILDFIKEMEESEPRSLTEQRTREISSMIVEMADNKRP